MTCTLCPLDTDDVDLPNALAPLVEGLADHVHDTWAQRRLREGRTYGPERDDDAQTYPCLVPYDDLLKAEKDDDRQTAIETLKATEVLGYTIVPARYA